MNNEDDFDFLIEENVEPFVTENKVIAINHHEIEEEEDDFRDPLPRNSIAHMSTIQYERDRPSVWNGFISLHAAPAKDIYKYDELKDALRNEYIDAIVSRLDDHEDELREITRENDRADANICCNFYVNFDSVCFFIIPFLIKSGVPFLPVGA